MMFGMKVVGAAATIGMAGFAVMAEEPLGQTGCSLRDTSGPIALALCPPGVGELVWQEAGRRACEGQAICGAWIWEDAAALPEKAPTTHDGLAPEAIAQARAIWVHEDESLIVLTRVGE